MLAAGTAASAQGDAYPSQRVTIVVPFSAAATPTARRASSPTSLSAMWKQPVIVENRPGVAGTASVAKAAPDGYTLMLTSSGHPVANVIHTQRAVRPW